MDIYAGNSLLCYKTIFTVELVIAEILMCNRLPKRKLFVLRVVLCVLALLGISYVIPNNISNVWYNCSIFFAIFACSLCGIKICFQTTWRSVLFCGIAAYSAQHIVSQLFDLSIVLMNVPLDGSGTGYISSANSWLPIFTYGSGTMMIGENPFIIIVYFAILFFTYLLFYCLAKPSMEKNSEPQIKNVPIFCLAIVIVVVDIIISALISDYSAGKFDRFYLVFQILMNVFCCVLALYMQFTFAIVGKLENEVEILNRLREQEREQYAQTKETIDLINMKCHDLKHQIRKFGEASFVDTQTIKNIEKMITIYDTSVKTGNEVLDVILTEKRLYCSNYDINFDCIADGSALSFMSNEEIYTLFGNLVDNAVEAVLLTTCVLGIAGATASATSFKAQAATTGNVSVSLTDGIVVKYYTSEAGTATFTNDVTALSTTVESKPYGDNQYVYEYTLITPQYLDSQFDITLNDAQTPVKTDYSVAQYCLDLQTYTADQLGITQMTYEQSVKVAKDLLYYGQAAKSYRLGGEITAEPTMEFAGVDGMALTGQYTDVENRIESATVVFDSIPAIKFNFKKASATAKVLVDGVDVTAELTEKDGLYTYTKTGVYATDFDKPLRVKFVNGSSVQTLKYSINDYTARTVANDKLQDDDMKSLAKALWTYGKSAQNLFDLPKYIPLGANNHKIETSIEQAHATTEEVLIANAQGDTSLSFEATLAKQFTGSFPFAYAMVGDDDYLYYVYDPGQTRGYYVCRYDLKTEEVIQSQLIYKGAKETEPSLGVTLYDGKIIFFGDGNVLATDVATFSADSTFTAYEGFAFADMEGKTLTDVKRNELTGAFAVRYVDGGAIKLRVYDTDMTTYAEVALQSWASGYTTKYMSVTADYIYINNTKDNDNVPHIHIYDWTGAYVGAYSADYTYPDGVKESTSGHNTQGIAWAGGNLYAGILSWGDTTNHIIRLSYVDVIAIAQEEACDFSHSDDGICSYCGQAYVGNMNGEKIQMENAGLVSFYHADGTTFNPVTSQTNQSRNNFGAEGYQFAGNMDGNATNGNVNGATIRVKVFVEKAGEYAMTMRSMSTDSTGHGSNSVALNTIYSGVQVNGTLQPIAGTVLPSTLTTGWVNMNRWTIVTVGTYELQAGWNDVWLVSKATRIPDIDWVRFTAVEDVETEKPTAQFISLEELDKNNSFTFSKDYGWTTYNHLYVRIAIDTATHGADYYDISVSKDNLIAAGFELTTAGTQTHDVTITVTDKAGTDYGTVTLSLTLIITE